MTHNIYTGRLLNSETNTFVDGAKVTLELDNKLDVVHSDSEGYYRFYADLRAETTSARIRVESKGYQKYNRNILLSTTDEKFAEIHLTPTKKKLENSGEKISVIATVIGTLIALATYMDINPVTSQQPSSQKSDSSPKPQVLSQQNCEPAYPDLCVPKNLSDLKCSDIQERNFKVLPPDPYGFDRNGNKIGCEK